jgi:hypothetical protein
METAHPVKVRSLENQAAFISPITLHSSLLINGISLVYALRGCAMRSAQTDCSRVASDQKNPADEDRWPVSTGGMTEKCNFECLWLFGYG